MPTVSCGGGVSRVCVPVPVPSLWLGFRLWLWLWLLWVDGYGTAATASASGKGKGGGHQERGPHGKRATEPMPTAFMPTLGNGCAARPGQGKNPAHDDTSLALWPSGPLDYNTLIPSPCLPPVHRQQNLRLRNDSMQSLVRTWRFQKSVSSLPHLAISCQCQRASGQSLCPAPAPRQALPPFLNRGATKTSLLPPSRGKACWSRQALSTSGFLMVRRHPPRGKLVRFFVVP